MKPPARCQKISINGEYEPFIALLHENEDGVEHILTLSPNKLA